MRGQMKKIKKMENTVYSVTCSDYEHVADKLEELLDMMGGMSQFVKPGERIVLKPNLLAAAPPEKAVTTHPAIVAAAGRMAKTAGAKLVIADSPGSGYPYSETMLKRTYRACGMEQAAQEAGIELNVETGSQNVSFPEGTLSKRFEIMTPILEAEGVFNLCKLKTHGFLSMTGAVKNMFGVIPGLAKPGYHGTLQDTGHFAAMCLDLSRYVAPRLSIMDAVVGMEGNGPNGGKPRHVGLLLGSVNPLALDVVAGEIMGLERRQNPILLQAEQRGLTPNHLDQVEVVGLDKSKLRVSDFKLPSTVGMKGFRAILLPLIAPLFKHALTVQPQVLTEYCVACGACRGACPVEAISINGNGRKYAQIDAEKCIRCYCCHEMCQYDAIELKQGFLYRLFNRSSLERGHLARAPISAF